jgi:hypothetical protein
VDFQSFEIHESCWWGWVLKRGEKVIS